jgi:hypothetical protein
MPVLAVRRRPCADDDSYHLERERRLRLAVIAAIICIFVIGPAISDAVRKTTPASVFMLAGSVAFVGLVITLVLLRPARPGRADWAVLVVTVGLGLALFIVGGEASLVILALAAAACGSFTRTPRPAIAGAIVCGAAGLGVAVADHYSFGDLALVTVVPSLPA